jgi:hypothetical protein
MDGPSGDSSGEAGAPVILNMDMLNAGLRAFRGWNPAELEAAGMVCEVFFAMLAECPQLMELKISRRG